MLGERIHPESSYIKLAYDVTPEAIAGWIKGSCISDEHDDELGMITYIDIGEGICTLMYASTQLLVFPGSDNYTMPLSLNMNETAVIFGEDSARFVSYVRQGSGNKELSDKKVISVVIESREITCKVLLKNDCDKQAREALDFIDSTKRVKD